MWTEIYVLALLLIKADKVRKGGLGLLVNDLISYLFNDKFSPLQSSLLLDCCQHPIVCLECRERDAPRRQTDLKWKKERLDEVCNACLLNSLTRCVTFTFAMRWEKGCKRGRQKLGRSVTTGFFFKKVWGQGGEHYQDDWREWVHRSTTLILHWPSAGQTGACPL